MSVTAASLVEEARYHLVLGAGSAREARRSIAELAQGVLELFVEIDHDTDRHLEPVA